MKDGNGTRRLVEVCQIDRAQGHYPALPYVGLEHIEAHTGKLIGPVTPAPVKSATFRFGKQHVLYGRLRPYLSKVVLPDFEGHCSTEIFPLRPLDNLTREYLCYWLLADSTVRKIDATCTGARMPRADVAELMQFELPVPPLTEQQRIVAILDEAFAAIDKARANTQKNLQNARELFESYLNQVFTERGEGWEEKRLPLGSAFVTVTGGTPPKNNAKLYGDYLPLVKPPELIDGDVYSAGDGLSETGAALARIAPPDSVLVSCIGNLGKVGVARVPVAFNQQINAILPDEGKAIPRFMFYQALSPGFREKLHGHSSGTTVSIVNKSRFNSIEIVLPALSEQQRIVATLDEASEAIDTARTNSEKKLAALDDLKKSLLHHAFNGEL